MLASLEETRHIVRYYNAWIEDGHLYIQMEKMDYSLDTLVSSPLTEATLMHILHDCLVGLSDIHKQQIVHLDIKVRACMLANGCVFPCGPPTLMCVWAVFACPSRPPRSPPTSSSAMASIKSAIWALRGTWRP